MSDTSINPLSVLNGLIFRQISQLINDPQYQGKLAKLRRATKWDYGEEIKSPKISNIVKISSNIVNAKRWDYYTSRQYKDDITLLVRQRIAEALSARITQEIMWILLSEVNKRLKTVTDSIIDKQVSQLVRENNDIARELSNKLISAGNNDLSEAVSDVAHKSTELGSIPDSETALESFSSQRSGSDEVVLDIGDKNAQLISQITELIKYFPKLDSGIESSILGLIAKNKEIAYKTGLSLGNNLKDLKRTMKSKVWEIAENDYKFAKGLGKGVGLIFDSLDTDDQETIIQMADRNPHFGFSFGSSLSHEYTRLDKGVRVQIVELAKRNPQFARALGGSVLTYIGNETSSNTVTRVLEIGRLPLKSDIDIGFILKPEEKPGLKHANFRLKIQAELNLPQVTLEIVELDVVSIKMGSLSMKLELLNPEIGTLGPTTITGNLPWKMKYDVINSLGGAKDSEILPRNGGEINPRHTSKYLDNGYFECVLFLDAKPEVLSEIGYVTYLLHPTFEKPVLDVFESENGFPLKLTVWGEFTVHIRLNYKDGHVSLLSHLLTLEPEAAVKHSRFS